MKDVKWPAKGGIKIIPPVPVDYFTLIEKIGFRNKEVSDFEEAMRNAVRRNPECLPKYFKELKNLRVASGETDTRSPADYLKELGFKGSEITKLLKQAGYIV